MCALGRFGARPVIRQMCNLEVDVKKVDENMFYVRTKRC